MAGETVDFTDLSTGDPTAWSWTFSGGTPGTSSSQNPTITYNTPGTYDVTLTVTRGGDSDTHTETAYITVGDPTEPPVADFEADVTTIFVGQQVIFSDLSTNDPTSWNWTFEGGTPATSGNQNPTVTYNTAGIYDVTLSVANSAGNDEMVKTDYITVIAATVGDLVMTEIMYNPPESGTDSLEYIEIYNNSDNEVNLLGYAFTAGIEYVFPEISLENGDYIVVAANAEAVQNAFGITAYQWTAGGLSNGGELIKLVSATGATVDSVEYGTSSPWPTEANGGGPSITICDPETENSIGNNWHASVHFLLNNGNGDAIYGSPMMNPAPVANFEANITELMGTGTVEFSELSICNATSFAWEFEGGTPATSSDPNPNVTYDMAGDFDVTLTVSNATGSHTITMEEYIHVGVGLAEQAINEISVMPNPSNGLFKLVNPAQEEMNIAVYSVLGNQIFEKRAVTAEEMIDLSDQQNGIYLLQVQMGDVVKTIRLIKR
jgi:PKD repeat protein